MVDGGATETTRLTMIITIIIAELLKIYAYATCDEFMGVHAYVYVQVRVCVYVYVYAHVNAPSSVYMHF